jgi:hypothetical protein
MKQYLFFSALSFLFTMNCRAAHGYAKDEYAVGYLITKGNDTVVCKILIPKDFGRFSEQSLFLRITILDSAGNKKKYTPQDINGYGFAYHDKGYIYVSRQVEEDGRRMFVWPLNLGKRVNEYYYYNYNSSNLDKGAMGAMNEVYVLEDAETKETVSITKGGSLSNSYKAQLRKFFEADKKMMALLVQDVKEFHDISRFAKDANH